MVIPRVLVISNNSFSSVYNNGKTLEALFSSFPKENIAQLFFHEASEPDFLFCNNYWKISEIDLIKSICTDRKSIGYAVEQSKDILKQIETKKYPRLLKFIKDKTGDRLRDILWNLCVWESPALYEWLHAFEPNVIFFVGSSAAFTSMVALGISKKMNIPLAIYYTDDYLFSIKQDSFFNKRKYLRIEKLYKFIIQAASAQFAIGELMSKEYSVFFNKRFIPIMNSVAIAPYEEYVRNDLIKIYYFGGLHLNRWRMLAKFASLLPEKCRLIVYSDPSNMTEEIKCIFNENSVIYGGVLVGSQLQKIMKSADILLHVESDDKSNRRFTRLAVSTKIPEYLITGIPVLGFGPKEVASMRILSENNVGFVISSESYDENIKDKIVSIVNNYEERKMMGQRGYEYAKNNFNRGANSRKLMSILSSIE